MTFLYNDIYLTTYLATIEVYDKTLKLWIIVTKGDAITDLNAKGREYEKSLG